VKIGLSTFFKLQRNWQTASGPPFLSSWIEIDDTPPAGMRPPVFSSTHYDSDEEDFNRSNIFGIKAIKIMLQQ